MIKVLIVDDSRVQQEFLAHILTSDPDIEIVGFAGSGDEAIEKTRLKKPDIITMDIHMPGMDGYEATRAIMETVPVPIVIVSSSLKAKEVAGTFKSLEAGALAVVYTPPGMEDPDFLRARKELIRIVRLMSEVKVIRRFPRVIRKSQITESVEWTKVKDRKPMKIIAIGASTGGPMALQTIFSRLPGDLPVPVLVVQHIAKGFIKGFKEWLASSSSVNIKIAEDNEPLEAATIYLAPDDYHMELSSDFKIKLNDLPPENGLRPSVNYLFRSVAKHAGSEASGILLTGMGKDGAEGLKTMKEIGASTFIQNQESSVVFGMPGEALRIGAADQALPPEAIAEVLVKLCSLKTNHGK